MIDLDYHKEMSQLYKSHMLGDKIDFKKFEAAFLTESELTRQRENELDIRNGVAVIEINGPLTPQASFFSFFFRGTSMPWVSDQLKLADESDEVKEKLFVMNTPGGTVEGAFELAQQTFESAKIKPIKTFTTGMIASAGYLIAAATDKIYISGITNQVGSIGVISTKSDWTEHDKNYGVEYTEYVSGKYKNVGSPDRKRDKFEDSAIQETVDYLAGLFFSKVEEYRGIDTKTISSLEAKLLIGNQAIDGGLVDGVSTIDILIDSGNSSADILPNISNKKIEVEKMSDQITVASLEVDHSEIYGSVKEAGKSEGMSEGILSERNRISGIHAVSMPGQDALVQECIEKGLSVGDSAIKLTADNRAKLEIEGQKIQVEAQEPVAIKEDEVVEQAVVADEKPKTPAEEFEASAELQADFGDFETYEAYLGAESSGRVRVLSKGGE